MKTVSLFSVFAVMLLGIDVLRDDASDRLP
jgi:hypothetical protein